MISNNWLSPIYRWLGSMMIVFVQTCWQDCFKIDITSGPSNEKRHAKFDRSLIPHSLYSHMQVQVTKSPSVPLERENHRYSADSALKILLRELDWQLSSTFTKDISRIKNKIKMKSLGPGSTVQVDVLEIVRGPKTNTHAIKAYRECIVHIYTRCLHNIQLVCIKLYNITKRMECVIWDLMSRVGYGVAITSCMVSIAAYVAFVSILYQ